MEQASGHIMVATLGGQPQVVTFTLDELLTQGFPIREVIVLYLSAEGSRVNRALERLQGEFEDDHYRGHPCRLRPMPVRVGMTRLPDIQSDQDAVTTSEMLRDLIIDLKRERYRLHVCLSGGRRMMALLLVPLAMTYFGYGDRLWHIYTPDEFQAQARDGQIMHARPEDGVRLIQVPLIPLGQHFPALRELTRPLTFPTNQPGWQDEAERERCRMVVSQLTPRELETLQAFAAGHPPQVVAEHLSISLNTVNTYKKKILELCRSAWPEQENLRYHHLREWFGSYFEQ
jgi:CRISPR-associated protein Csx14